MEKFKTDLISISPPDEDLKIEIEVLQGDGYRDENDKLTIDFDDLYYWVTECERGIDINESIKKSPFSPQLEREIIKKKKIGENLIRNLDKL